MILAVTVEFQEHRRSEDEFSLFPLAFLANLKQLRSQKQQEMDHTRGREWIYQLLFLAVPVDLEPLGLSGTQSCFNSCISSFLLVQRQLH